MKKVRTISISISIIILVLIAGVISVMVTRNIRNDAELALKREEKITSSVNNQLIKAQELKDDFERKLQQADDDRRFKRFLEGKYQ